MNAAFAPRRGFLAAFAALVLVAPQARAEDLTAIDDLRRGAPVSVAGIVERITDEDEFRLADESGRVRVYIGPNAMPVREGDAITVRGRMDDDIGRLELYAHEIVLADGRVIALRQGY